MKWIMWTGILLFGGFESNAQSKQIKLYLEQIVANKIYIEYLQKGYSVVKGGLTTIGNIKNGHFRLDSDFFTALESINPKISNYAKVADIVNYNINIVREFKWTIQQKRQTGLLSSNELTYIERVFTNLTDGCTGIIDALTLFITPAQVKMTDDERIRQIDALYEDMRDRYAFSKDFCSGINILMLQRKKELNEVKTLRGLHGIK